MRKLNFITPLHDAEHVAQLSVCEKLLEIGGPRETTFCWVKGEGYPVYNVVPRLEFTGDTFIPAYTEADLYELLPKGLVLSPGNQNEVREILSTTNDDNLSGENTVWLDWRYLNHEFTLGYFRDNDEFNIANFRSGDHVLLLAFRSPHLAEALAKMLFVFIYEGKMKLPYFPEEFNK